jgi:hypothetical protein
MKKKRKDRGMATAANRKAESRGSNTSTAFLLFV